MRALRLTMLLACAAACNAVDGADGYTKSGDGAAGDGAAQCPASCLDTAATCLASCTTTFDACIAGSCNPGCMNKCNGNHDTCTKACTSTCQSCSAACTPPVCMQPPPVDAGDDATVDAAAE